jgi:hypothetical protein
MNNGIKIRKIEWVYEFPRIVFCIVSAEIFLWLMQYWLKLDSKQDWFKEVSIQFKDIFYC